MKSEQKPPRLVLILGDQLSIDISSLKAAEKSRDIIVMAEVGEEASYVKHHKKKIIFLFSAMRHFAHELRQKGWRIEYTPWPTKGAPAPSFRAVIADEITKHKAQKIMVTEPGEWRLLEEMKTWPSATGVPIDILDDDRFLCTHQEFSSWAQGRKTLRMEYFYREMRKKTGLLMDHGAPIGGQWNFDQENRKPPQQGLSPPAPQQFKPDEITQEVISLVENQFHDHFGAATPFWFAVTNADAQRAADDFFKNALPLFGDYQDAMIKGEPFLFHSVLSHYVNAGLLNPLTLCRQAEQAYDDGRAPLNAVEGFIRQIIGWREYVRGLYWRQGPSYTKENFFSANRALPEFYWTAKTDMACLRSTIKQTKDEAYAHHIQRLMITGNFALLAGLDPFAVHEWYLAVYADAYEWVEAPNVIGMALFADGGRLASKPYAASGAYINRMSTYCAECAYNVRKKTEEGSCPFNALYWDFLVRNEKYLNTNPRLGRIFSNWDRLSAEKKRAYRRRAKQILKRLDAGQAQDL